MSWKRLAHVRGDTLNEWFVLLCLETHQRSWITTLETVEAINLQIAERSLKIELKMASAEKHLTKSLQGMSEYAELMDECEMKQRQIMGIYREREIMMEKWASHSNSQTPIL